MHLPRSRFAKFVLLCLFILPFIFPDAHSASLNCIIGSNNSFGGCIANSVPLASIGILFSFLLIAVTYMVGKVIKSGGLEGWYKGELNEVMKSILILVIIYSLISIASGIAVTIIGSTPASGNGSVGHNTNGLYNGANSYINTELVAAQSAYGYVTSIAYATDFLKSIEYSIWVPFPVFPPIIFAAFQSGSSGNLYVSSLIDSTSSAKNLSFLKDSYNFVVIPMLFVFQAQSTLLSSIIAAGLLIFIPGGILFRAMPFMRGLGGTLIAIGIAFALLYPTVLVTLNAPITQFMSGIVPAPPSVSGCSINGAGAIGWLIDIGEGEFCNLSSIQTYGLGIGTGFLSLTSIYPAFNGIFSYIFPLIIQFVLFVLDIMIVYIIAQEIAKMLGGNLRLGIGKFKLA